MRVHTGKVWILPDFSNEELLAPEDLFHQIICVFFMDKHGGNMLGEALIHFFCGRYQSTYWDVSEVVKQVSHGETFS